MSTLRDVNEKEYFRLRRQLDEEHQAGVAALDRVWRLANSCQPPTGKRAPHKTDKGNVASEVRRVVAEIAQGVRFTVPDVISALIQSNPDKGEPPQKSTVSHVLIRLREEEVIEQVEKGVGRNPTIYQKK